ncbi:MAG: hypothetical protein WBE74_00615 [Terracidiphilus sp.]
MSFLTDFWDLLNSPADQALEKIYHTPSKQWVAQFAPPSSTDLATVKQTEIVPRKHYITVTSQKTVLPYDRVLFKTFYGAVYSTIIVRDEAGEPRSLSTFASLDSGLTAIDKHAGEKMVQGPRTLLEFAPFQGTQMASTIALLAVEAVDYSKPLLSTLQKISDIAGGTFFSVAAPLAEPLISGIEALTEVAGGTGTQIVYAGNLPRNTGIFLVAATDASGFDWSNYSFSSDYTLLESGVPVNRFAYMVLTIEVAEERQNWMQIPAIREAEAALDQAVRAAGRKIADPKSEENGKVQDALAACIWECTNNPDLCEEDGERCADLISAKIDSYVRRYSKNLSSFATDRAYGDIPTDGFSLQDIELFPRP